MNPEDFVDYFAKLLSEVELNDDSAPLFSMHKSEPPSQDQTPISEPTTSAPTQDQAEHQGVDDTPFEEAVPLEDELASLLDDIDD